jgi:hypothetical protein
MASQKFDLLRCGGSRMLGVPFYAAALATLPRLDLYVNHPGCMTHFREIINP